MRNQILTLLITLLIGVGLGFAGSYLFVQRYTVTKYLNDVSAIKTDRWTGKTWLMRYYKDEKNGTTTFYWDPMPQR